MRLKTLREHSIVLRTRRSVTIFLLAAVTTTVASCTKESSLGLDVQPSNDILQVGVQDTTTVISYTEREDSVRSDEPPLSLFGTIVDPVFGKTSAGIFAQFSVPGGQQNISFGTMSDLVLDSTVLTLAYRNDFYGDTTQAQTLRVYQMTQSIYKDSAYYSNRAKQFYPVPLATKTYVPHPRTKVTVDGVQKAAHLRIPLDPNFGNIIFSQSGGTNLASNANWTSFMKGLYIAPDTNFSSGGAIMNFSMLDSLTTMTLYYHKVSTPDTLTFSFRVNSGTSAYYEYFTHNYTSTPIAAALTDTIGNYPDVFIHAMAGLRGRIKIPYITKWADIGPIAVNKAELVMQVDPAYVDALHAANAKLYLAAANADGSSDLLIDMLDNSAAFGGSYNSTTNEYRINLPRHIQRMIEGTEPNYGFYLREIDPVQSAKRVALGSSKNTSPALKMYLRIAYTKIN